jgi:hypothetical protein
MAQVPANQEESNDYSADTFDPSQIEFVGHKGDTMPADAAAEEAITEFEDADNTAIITQIRIQEKREDARGRLAAIFTIATFVIFVLAMLIAAISEGNKVDNIKEVMITVSGIFSGLLGFVIGYYFRKGDEA